MDDVFDLSENDKDVELKVANQEWLKKMREVAVHGEREALGDGFDSRCNSIFNSGLNTGFEAARDLSILKGRVMFYKSVQNVEEASVDRLMSELETLEAEVIRLYASNKEYSISAGVSMPDDLSSRISNIKEAVYKLLGLQIS